MPCDIFCSGSNNPEPRSQYIEKAKCCLPTHLPEHQDGSLPDQNSGLKPDQAHFHTPDLGFRSPFTFTIAIYKTNYSQIHSLTSLHLLPYMKTYIDYPFLYLSHYQFCSQVHPGQGSPLLRSAPTAFSSPLVCWQVTPLFSSQPFFSPKSLVCWRVTRAMSRPDNAIFYSFHKLWQPFLHLIKSLAKLDLLQGWLNVTLLGRNLMGQN